MKTSILPVIMVLYPIFGGILVYFLGRKNETYRDLAADFIAISEFVLALAAFLIYSGPAASGAEISCHLPWVCGMGLYFCFDGFRLIYGLIAALMWMMTTVLSREYFAHHNNRSRFYMFLLMTLGATMGVFLSSDLFTTFIFFEIMSFTSYAWVAQEEDAPSLRAASTYLGVAVIGGLVMLMGIFMLYAKLGTLNISELLPLAEKCNDKSYLYWAGALMLFGFGAKAGAFPLHIWLPKAHPVAPAPASALLSGILTKSGIFGILVVSSNLFLHDFKWGGWLLLIGLVTMFGGALLAVFSIDLKRTLACSSMSQIGFILIGAGMQGMLGEENALAVHGTVLHMVNHSLIKLVLFMAAGVIFMNAHALDLNKIRGFGRRKPLLMAIFLTGALAIGGIPMFGGYISKTLLHESIVEYGGGIPMKVIEWIFLISGGMTVAYMTKLFAAIFIEKNKDQKLQAEYDAKKQYMNRESRAALGGSALILLIWGLFPHRIMDRAAHLCQSFMHLSEAGHQVHYFSMTNLSGALISIAIGGGIYFLIIRTLLIKDGEYVNRWPSWLDIENLIYRPLLLLVLPTVFGIFSRIFDSLLDGIVVLLRKTIYKDSPIPHERLEGSAFSEFSGRVCNAIQSLANATWRRKNPEYKDYVHIFAMHVENNRESNTLIGRSLTFGLFMFYLGLSMTLVYIIFF